MGTYAVVDYSIISPYVDARAESNTFTMGNPMPESTLINPMLARVDFIPQSGT